jgi:transcriptional regulator with XRE-family HTH domain
MTENWFAVNLAIRLQMENLNISQTQLIIRSGLSKAIVSEFLHGVIRNRSPRTLAAMSEGLGWHRDHLESLLHARQTPPAPAKREIETAVETSRIDEISTTLHNIERQLIEIDEKINKTLNVS